MESIDYTVGIVKSLVWSLVSLGISFMLVGALIFIYPDLLGILVGTLLVFAGLIALFTAIKVNRHAKIKIGL